MGFLAPLFLAGLGALSIPFILHLVRRTPRSRFVFSSLMFLAPTPPRLTRRSRLDQLLLLLARLAALGLLALAFSRPFIRESSLLTASDLPSRRVALLVDASASMRREDLWKRAIDHALAELSDLGPSDDVALFTFTDRLETVVGFERTAGESNETRRELVRQQLAALRPTWRTSDLGEALATLAAEMDTTSDVRQSAAEPRIVLVSDLQKGSRIDRLQSTLWPDRVTVRLRRVTPKRTTNAFAHLLERDEQSEDAEPRVRIVNAANSQHDQFYVQWGEPVANGATAKTSPTAKSSELAVYVPPGQSRVVRLPRPVERATSDRIVLRGDDHDFDNTHFVVPPNREEVAVLYVGGDKADDPQGPRYYLELALADDPLRKVKFVELAADDAIPPELTQAAIRSTLLVVTRAVAAPLKDRLLSLVEQGATLLAAPASNDAASLLPMLLADVEPPTEPIDDSSAAKSDADSFLLLGEIDFTHPLFAPFASPRYGDFTKIHFWARRPIRLQSGADKASSTNDSGDGKSDATRVLARFDNGEPAVVERTIGKGRVLGWASSWAPDDSQLAVSSRFVPMMNAVLDLACGTVDAAESVRVGEVDAIAADAPGVYAIARADRQRQVAVNLASSESDTAEWDEQQLKQWGVRLGDTATRNERLERQRQERDVELESRQKVWRWLVVGALVMLILETVWAAWQHRAVVAAQEGVT